MNDWNNNGKKDIQDDFIEYNIYTNSTGEPDHISRNHSSGGMSTFWAVICTLGILLFIGWITGSAEPKYAYPDCDNWPAGGSSYSSGYKNNSGKSTYHSNKADDPYNAKDYSDAEDFYDDNYDDFDGYEDAEDYYDEWGE